MSLTYPQWFSFGRPLGTFLYTGFGYDPNSLDQLNRLEQKQVATGSFWFYLFAARLDFTGLGVRLLPGLQEHEAPVVKFRGQTVYTYATCAGSSTAWLVYVLGLHESADRWSILRSEWSKYEEGLLALQQAIEGDGTSIERLRDLVFDDAIQQGLQEDRFGDLSEEIVTRLDPSPQVRALLDWHRETEASEKIVPSLPDNLGPWRKVAATLAFDLNRFYRHHHEASRAAWAMLQEPANLDPDTTYSGRPPTYYRRKPYGKMTPVDPASWLVDHPTTVDAGWKNDPLWRAVVALADQGLSYDGAQHLEAAGELQAAGRPEDAFKSLVNAAHWSALAHGAIADDVRAAIEDLVRELGWHLLGEALSEYSRLADSKKSDVEDEEDESAAASPSARGRGSPSGGSARR